jgi:hypothetical protein
MADPNTPPTIETPKNCGHEECHCLAAPQSSYCSEACEHAARLDALGPCPCSHPECLAR